LSQVTISRRALSIQASPIRKLAPLAEAAKQKGTHVYHLNIGQPDIPTPGNFWSEVRERVPEVLAYGPSQGIPQLREAICTYYARSGIILEPDQVMITTGGSEAVLFAMLATCDPGDRIVCFEPFYTNYNGFATMAGVELVPVTLSVENGFHLPDAGAIEEKIDDRTRALLICSPNNPTGTVLTPGELDVLASIVTERGLFLIADEVYRDFTFDGRTHKSILEIPGIEDRAIVTDSISKRFSSCGARLGDIITRNAQLMTHLVRFGQARLCPPTLSQYGAAHMYNHLKADYFSQVSGEYQKRRDVLMEEIAFAPGVFLLEPEGAFYATLRIPVDDADRFAAWMLTDFSHNGATTMVAPAAGFYATEGLGRDEIRIAFVLEENSMRSALEILRMGLSKYRG
jgi:aspartate aminotransferase